MKKNDWYIITLKGQSKGRKNNKKKLLNNFFLVTLIAKNGEAHV